MGFCLGSYGALLKLFATAKDPHALVIFAEMQSVGVSIDAGLLANLLKRCASVGFASFAEEIERYMRAHAVTSVALYRNLVKVYADAGMQDRALDLYSTLLKDGLEPDH